MKKFLVMLILFVSIIFALLLNGYATQIGVPLGWIMVAMILLAGAAVVADGAGAK